MTDEWTPEERKLIDDLPRERQPAGLENRVVDAMRDRGFLRKRPRLIAVTGGRVAGLLAACVALVIGAYSIGLQRGVDSVELADMQPATLSSRADAVVERQQGASEDAETAPAAAEPDLRAEAPAADKPTVTRESKLQQEADAVRDGLAKEEEVAEKRAPAPGPVTIQEPAAGEMAPMERRLDVAQPKREATTVQSPKTKSAANGLGTDHGPFIVHVNGRALLIELPDSVRVTRENGGRVILIHTSDGVIRVYPTDPE